MSQDSNTENSSSGKRKLTLKKRNPDTPAEQEQPPQEAPPLEPGLKDPFAPEHDLTQQPSPIPSNEPAPPPEPKKIPISFAEEQATPPEPADSPPPELPAPSSQARMMSPEPNLPPVIEAYQGPRSSTSYKNQKAPKQKSKKGVFAVTLIFIALIAVVGVFGYGTYTVFFENKDNTADDASSNELASLSSEEDIPDIVRENPDLALPSADSDEDIPLDATTDPLELPSADSNEQGMLTLPDEFSSATASNEPDPLVQEWVEQLSNYAASGRVIIIYNQSYRIGSIVNAELGIRWIKHDPDLQVLTFQDSNGALYEKDY
ncbi:MAG: hypothetical protein AAGA45_02975 [Verrucomicrobiota bacterium]